MKETRDNHKVLGVIGTLIAEPGHREDIVVGVRNGKVDVRCYVNNQKSNPPFIGFATRGAYLNVTLDQFLKLVEMKDEIVEALQGQVSTAELDIPAQLDLAKL